MSTAYMVNPLPVISKCKNKSDSEVWTALKNDDKNAFEHVYQIHIQSLYNYGMRVSYDDVFISEVIQDLFVDIWNQRKNLSDVKNLKCYLLKALRYKIFKRILKTRKANFTSLQDLADEVSIISPHEERLILSEVADERKFLIASKISKLSDRQREIINLYFFENYSYQEISEIMSINQRSVYTLAWKAISNLRKQFKEIKVV